jgi:hypothetical protein
VIKKDFIRRVLWERDFIQTAQRDLVEKAVGSFRAEYIGVVSEEGSTIESIKNQTLNNFYTATVRMLTSYMMNFLFEKIIDEVLDILKKEGVK